MEKVRVKKIEIINFKGIEYLELDFTYPNSDRILDNIVFYGINGSGKSTILEAINLSILMLSFSPAKNITLKMLEEFFIQNFSLGKDWIYNNKEEFKLNIQLVENINLIESTLIYNQNKGLKLQIKNREKIPKKFQKFPMEYLSSYRLFYPTKVNHAGDWSKIEELRSNIFSMIENHSLGLQFTNDYNSVKQYLVNLITDKKVGVINDENLKVLEKIKEAFNIFFPDKVFLEQLSREDMNQDYKFLIQNEDKNVQLFLATHSEEIHQSLSESELFELIK